MKVRTRNSPKSRRRATPRPNGARDLFEGRFSEILIIFVLALIVLGPEKLPRVVSEVGRWVGRARAMARQFREQLEEEVQLEQARKAQRPTPASAPEPPTAAAPSVAPRGNGHSPPVTPDTTHRDPPADTTAADATATRPAEAGGTDERRT
ncbi:MAG TPA: Sec-independent protein translocase protein TatB [Steroidobacteraceae bacterium]